MKQYKDIHGDSGVDFYDYGPDWIRIQFNNGGTYEFRSSQIGVLHLSEMKRLADSGDRLNTYINTHPEIKNNYSSKTNG